MTTRALTRSLPRLSSTFHHISYTTYPIPRCTPSYTLLATDPEWCNPENGFDFEHWQVFLKSFRKEKATRDQIIDTYIKTLAMFVGSEEEARMRIYSISTEYSYYFGFRGSPELADEIQELPRVRFVVPDQYIFHENQDYGGAGEPFINGHALPYDPKYYKLWNEPKVACTACLEYIKWKEAKMRKNPTSTEGHPTLV